MDVLNSELITGSYTLVNDVELRLNYLSMPLMLLCNCGLLNIGLGANCEGYIALKDLSNNPLVKTDLF